MYNHFLNVAIGLRGDVVFDIECHARPGDSCKISCIKDCATWPCGHEMIKTNECQAAVWLTEEDDMEHHYAKTHYKPLYNGMPIVVEWNGNNYEWYIPGEFPADTTAIFKDHLAEISAQNRSLDALRARLTGSTAKPVAGVLSQMSRRLAQRRQKASKNGK